MTRLTYAEAAKIALQQEMERDPLVWALGEDLGPEGGVAGQYRGLQQMYGRRRVMDTPISENTMMGAAVGAAVGGTRPVVELRFADFGYCAADEIINQAAKIRFMFDGQARVPLVVRQAMGFRSGMAAQHSQSTEALWVHVPGLVVMAPATPADSHALLKAAIRCEDPVIYLEHKDLWPREGEVDVKAAPAEIGRCERVRDGSDLTIVTWSRMRHLCDEAATTLDAAGISVELIDLRTLWPWDVGGVLESVRKTGRLLVVHEAVEVAGLGAEICATVATAAWSHLKAPPARLGGPRAPTPFSAPLEALHRISADKVAAAARKAVAS